MTARFDQVTIVGVGLLGGSLGLALKSRGLAGKITGVGHRQCSLEKAVALSAVDAVSLDVREAAREADLVVICTPAATVTGTLDALLPVVKPEAIVTDVASTKAAICRHARNSWPKPLRFIGSHPMAGSEKFGPEHARADLYAGCVTIVQTGDELDGAAREAVVDLWHAVGARVIGAAPEAHDELVARTSHIPHIAATALAALAGKSEEAGPFIGQGFRDATRIAASRPEVWRDICLTNAEAIHDALEEYMGYLRDLGDAVSRQDAGALETFFRNGNDARRKALRE